MTKVSEREREKEKRVVPHMVMPGKNRKIYSEGHIKSIKRLKTDISTIKDESMNSKFGKMPEGQQVIYPSTYTSIYIYIYILFVLFVLIINFVNKIAITTSRQKNPKKKEMRRQEGREKVANQVTQVCLFIPTHTYI